MIYESSMQGITFEKARRAENRSLKMTIWTLASCFEETIRQGGATIRLSTRGHHFNTTMRPTLMLLMLYISTEHITNY